MKISVIIPVFKAEKTIAETLDSVRAQTRPADEVILVDDGSPDDSVKIAQKYIDLHQLTNWKILGQANQGSAIARTTGIRAASGDWIALLDSDDLWHPAKLQRQEALIQKNPQTGLVYCAQEYIDEAGRHLAAETARGHKPYLRGMVYESLLLKGNHIVGSSSAGMFRKDLWEQSGGEQVQLRVAEDWELWLRLSKYAWVDYCDEILVKIRLRPHSNSYDPVRMIKGDLDVLVRYQPDQKTLRAYLDRSSRKEWLKLILSGRLSELVDLGKQFTGQRTAPFLWEVARQFLRSRSNDLG